jgi:hypothetical protein
VEHEYDRGGAVQYLAAWDCHRAKVFGSCESRTGIAPFGAWSTRSWQPEPYAPARRVFFFVGRGLVAPGGGLRRPPAGSAPEPATRPHPVHSSWLNQVEIYFLVLQPKVLTPNNFVDIA